LGLLALAIARSGNVSGRIEEQLLGIETRK
jgi:hypothetical protein